MVKVSIIIPVFNVAQYLRQCLDSVLKQTLNQMEILCIDDGSEDDSYDILLEYQKKYENIIILRQRNQGAGPARNYGIRKATGKYLCFMDPDDYYAQESALEKLYLAAEEKHALICGGNILLQSAYGEKKEQDRWFSYEHEVAFKDFGYFYHFQRYIFSSKLIEENNIVFPPYRRFQDPPFLVKAMICAQRFYALNEIIYMHRVDYKEVDYTLKTAIDILCGIRDCYEMAQKSNVDIMYESELKNILYVNLKTFYKYAVKNEKRIWDLINEINAIRYQWMGESGEVFRSIEHLETYVAQQRETKERMLAACHTAQQIVIYGAGKVGRCFLQHWGEKCNNIIGFAVSEKGDNEDFIEGYAVREITEYSREALIIVAAAKKGADEIRRNLARLHFGNVWYVEYAAFSLLEEE